MGAERRGSQFCRPAKADRSDKPVRASRAQSGAAGERPQARQSHEPSQNGVPVV